MPKQQRKHLLNKILRPISATFEALVQVYGRVALFLYLRGLNVPGTRRLRDKLDGESLAALERRALIRDIRSQRFAVRHGPLWIRAIGDRGLRLLSINRVWVLFALKATVGFVLVALPIGIFVLVRGSLPVPERVPREEVELRLSASTRVRTDWLYTEPPFAAELSTPTDVYNYLAGPEKRNINVTPVLEPGVPAGLMHFGVGAYPRRVELLRGFLASDRSALKITRQRNVRIDVAGRNRLRARFYLLPKGGGQAWCRLEVRDHENKLILNAESLTPKNDTSPGGFISTSIRQRFTPAAVFGAGEIREFTLDTDHPPPELRIRVARLGQSQAGPSGIEGIGAPDAVAGGIAPFYSKPVGNMARGRALDDDECVYALGDFSFESEQVKPLPRRGVIFIVADTLRAKATRDSTLMPNVASFAQTQSAEFRLHQAQGNMTMPSISSMLTSIYPRQLGNVAFNYSLDPRLKSAHYAKNIPTLPSLARSLGYQTAAIGNLALISETLQGGVDFGFHNAIVLESPQYETRHITEEATRWLESYGESPFFLYLHYHTMHGPYRPPVQDLALLKLLTHPFGLRREQELYNGLARYFDREFGDLMGRLESLGLKDNVDIVLTADHGAQLEEQPFGFYKGIDAGVRGATRDKGHTLSQEEINVPFYVQIAGAPHLAGRKIEAPSAHVDVLPTFLNLLGGSQAHNSVDPKARSLWRGLDLSTALTRLSAEPLNNLLRTRDVIFSEGYRHSGVLLFGEDFAKNPIKYVRQFHPESVELYRHKWPWRRREKWFEPEQFFSVDAKSGAEKWLPFVTNDILARLRAKYLSLAPLGRVLRMQALFSGEVSFEVTLALENKAQTNQTDHTNQKDQHTQVLGVVDNLPKAVTHQQRVTPKGVVHIFQGQIQKGEEILLNFGHAVIQNIVVQTPLKFTACQAAVTFETASLVENLKLQTSCLYQLAPSRVLLANAPESERFFAVSLALVGESTARLEMNAAGDALAQALKDWGYAKD